MAERRRSQTNERGRYQNRYRGDRQRQQGDRNHQRDRSRGGNDFRKGYPKKEIVVSSEFHQKKVAILENSHIEEFYIEHDEDAQLVGSIYKGKVSSIIPGIGAAFVSIGLEKNGFLYVGDVVGEDQNGATDEISDDFDDEQDEPPRQPNRKPASIQELLTKDQEILVQVVKEPFGTKGARLTGQITLPGRFVVLMPYSSHKGISKRIDDPQERDRIKQIIKSLNLPKNLGMIVRTAAWGCSQADMSRDVKFLLHQWKAIQKRYQVRTAPALLHEEYGIILRMMRDVFNDRFHSVTFDSPEEYRKATRFINATVPHLGKKIQLFKGDNSLFVLKNIERDAEKIYDAKCMLRSGGSIVIEQTEALVSIDVNTGKFTGRINLEDTAYKTNCEAAREIAKQIRLRDLGGIIIIDFIDMDTHDHRRSVLRILEDALKKDRAKTSILNLSQLGLVEMTRQRIRKSLQTTNTQTCPYCTGKGVVKSNKRLAVEALQKADGMIQRSKHSHVEITVTPEVADILLKSNYAMVREVEKKNRCRINIMVDTNLQPEDLRLKRILDRRRMWLKG